MYRHFDGWNTSLSLAISFSQLPDKAKSYIAQLEQLLETQISMVSTGPEREKLLSKK